MVLSPEPCCLGMSLRLVTLVSNASEQTDVTPEEYRDTLRACCKDHWDWSSLVNFAYEYFTHLGLASLYNPSSPFSSNLYLLSVYDFSSSQMLPTIRGDGETPQTPHFQSLEEIHATLGTCGHSGQKEMIMLVNIVSPNVSLDLLKIIP